MQHQVVINVSNKNGENSTILKGSQITLPKKIIQWLFGDYTQIFVMKPGQTIKSVDIKEIKKG
ncbi:hypothetical protein [Gemelliphila palaticanis]|uniref:Uncharacterized protein n=1 Tax=Gemelliphila palaticanis TaxID=81950 RepID=A0ABX2T0J1_9BACL|nr:hypothetical protein [Gemella palaticanis]MBF0714974.1 hypothetical protein [Gemella palaticanis]NYS46904.1 hypothetical protein [Gemella palaticanis]